MKNLTITENITIKEAMKQLDLTAEKVLLVVDNEKKLIGTLTDGDVRRGILSGRSLEDSIDDIYNTSPSFLYDDTVSAETVKHILLEKKIELLPVVDRKKHVVDYITWDSIFSSEETRVIDDAKKINIPVVIMAGGKGTRMEPFTKVLPKPLIPIGDKTIAELIMEQFALYGVDTYYYTLNYKGEMIKAYFNSIDHDYTIHYVHEEDFLGTAGSLKLLENDLPGTFILSNCDIIVRADYSEVLQFHIDNKSDLTVLSAVQHHQIPYGVIKFGKNGIIESIEEKPEHSFTINTGVYFINSDCLELIPGGKFFHLTELIEKLIDNGKKVYTYPVNTNDYIDIGQWDEYRNIISKVN